MKNRNFILARKEKLNKGEVVHYNTNNLLAIRWMDKRKFCMLIILHFNQMTATSKEHKQGNYFMKPICIINYNSNMRVLDKKDRFHSTPKSV